MSKKQFLVALLVLAVSGLAGGFVSDWLLEGKAQATSIPDRIMAREFVLVDDNYKPRAVLKVGNKGALLALTDSKQNIKALLQGFGPSGELYLAGQDGKIRLKLGERDSNGIGLRLLDHKEKTRASFILEDNYPEIIMSYAEEKPGIAIGLKENMGAAIIAKSENTGIRGGIIARDMLSSFLLSDENSRYRINCGYVKDKGGLLSFTDSEGTHRLTLGLSPTMGAQMNMTSNKNDYRLRLMAAYTGSQISLYQSKDSKYSVGALGVSDKQPWFVMRNSDGGRFDTIFSEFGQPYLLVANEDKKIWSAPPQKPPGTLELKLPFLDMRK